MSLERPGLYSSAEVNHLQLADPDTLLALEVDGEPLSLDHGFPLRLIGPNRPGVLQTKWVTRWWSVDHAGGRRRGPSYALVLGRTRGRMGRHGVRDLGCPRQRRPHRADPARGVRHRRGGAPRRRRRPGRGGGRLAGQPMVAARGARPGARRPRPERAPRRVRLPAGAKARRPSRRTPRRYRSTTAPTSPSCWAWCGSSRPRWWWPAPAPAPATVNVGRSERADPGHLCSEPRAGRPGSHVEGDGEGVDVGEHRQGLHVAAALPEPGQLSETGPVGAHRDADEDAGIGPAQSDRPVAAVVGRPEHGVDPRPAQGRASRRPAGSA